MKTWIIPAVALSLLLASPAALAAPADQNSSSQQDQHKAKGSTAGSSTRNRNVDANRNVIVKRPVEVKRTVIVKRPVEVKRNVVIKRPVAIRRNVIVKRPVVVNRNVRVNRTIDLRVYRRNFSSPRRYHWNVYRRPAGWYNHRWAYGERLPRGWFARDYWISSFLMFGLMAPPDGYVWVRVGDDALLIDADTGEVIRVVYGVFY